MCSATCNAVTPAEQPPASETKVTDMRGELDANVCPIFLAALGASILSVVFLEAYCRSDRFGTDAGLALEGHVMADSKADEKWDRFCSTGGSMFWQLVSA